MAKKLTQKELSALRAEYLKKREDLLKSKVNSLSVKLWDKIFEHYLKALELNDGKLIASDQNINMVAGLDSVYRTFTLFDNIPVITGVINDYKKIIPLNERYFKNIEQYGINATTEKANKVVDRTLGILEDGSAKQNGFVDKFINDKTLLKTIKKQTIQAITKGIGFQDFRQDLKTTIKGSPGVPNSGGLHQYYRNYAYDTYQKVDRLTGNVFANELSLRYFYYQGGLIDTSRPFCEKCNGMIIDSLQFQDLTFDKLQEKYRDGIPDGSVDVWDPMSDLGGYGCRHSIDWIANSIAERYSSKILDVLSLT